jgi:hypothetical protein
MMQAKEISIEHFEIACDTKDDHLKGGLSFSLNTNAESLNAQIRI